MSILESYEANENGGYIGKDGCYWDDLKSLLQCDVLGFCGCGKSEANLSYILAGLEYLNETRQEPYEEWREDYKRRGLKLFGNSQAQLFFLYWADKKQLTEHGSNIYSSYLTDKGKDLLKCLKQFELENDLLFQITKGE